MPGVLVSVFPSLFWELEDGVCYTSVKGSVMLKIKIKVNDVIQAPKNKNTLMHFKLQETREK